MNKTKDGILVQPGQIWRDLDKRMGNRHCCVLSVVGAGDDAAAVMRQCRPNGQYISYGTTKIRIRRMHKSSTGWELVR